MKSRAYTSGAKAVDQYGGQAAEIHFDDGRVVQISSLGEDKPILLRMWEPGGTMEYGYTSGGYPGNAMPVLSAIIRLTDVAVIEEMHVRGAKL